MKLTTRGFTLVELMIVIAIIGILAAALFPSMTAYLKRSRDAARSSNLKDISTAVGAYYSDTESYPTIAAAGSGCVNGTAIANTNYFPKGTPQDPKDASQSPCGYATGGKGNYGYGGTTGGTGFVVTAKMENNNGGNLKMTITSTGTNVNVTNIQSNIDKGTGAIMALTN